MSQEALIKQLSIVFADTFALYLKTLNYHWHVSGENFYALHQLFEHHYTELAEAVDTLAERIVALGSTAPGTLSEIQKLATLQEGNAHNTSQQMIAELEEDHRILIQQIKSAVEIAKALNDEGTITLLGERLAAHEKKAWMLRTSEEV